jgi:hypothetical protein
LGGSGRADSITENFNIYIQPPATLGGEYNAFQVDVPQFDPTNGTLTSVSMSIMGIGGWSSTSSFPKVFIGGIVNSRNTFEFGMEQFTTPGGLSIFVSGSSSDSGLLADVTGTGTIPAGVEVFDVSSPPFTDTFQTSQGGIPGTLTYTFTPEPASLTLFGISAVGSIGYAWRKRQRAAA